MTRPRPHPSHDSSHPHPPTPLARTLLQCVILGLRCQKIIMPINFTHAGCSSFSLPSPSPPLSTSAALVVNYTTKNYVCLLPATRVGVPLPSYNPSLYACVCRLRLILPHSFGSNLSCHAVIMTNKKKGKKEILGKNYLLKMIMHRESAVGSRLCRWTGASPPSNRG